MPRPGEDHKVEKLGRNHRLVMVQCIQDACQREGELRAPKNVAIGAGRRKSFNWGPLRGQDRYFTDSIGLRMFKHKLIIKEFKYRERIRKSYGLQRLKTIYQPDHSEEDHQQVLQSTEDSSESSNEEFYCFQGYFLGCDADPQTSDYNPYDLFINQAINEAQAPPPSKIAALNAAFLSSMQIADETAVCSPRRVSFSSEVEVLYFDAQVPICEGSGRSEKCSISWA